MSIPGNFLRWGLAALGGAAMYAANKFYSSSDKPVKEEKKLNNDEMKQTKEMYDRLKLGNYSEEKIEYLHRKDIDQLTAKEIYDQLSTYASFGLGTSLNRSLNRVEQKDSSVQDPIYKVYMEAIYNVDCLDAGMPYGDWKEVDRCQELKDKLYEKIKKENQP